VGNGPSVTALRLCRRCSTDEAPMMTPSLRSALASGEWMVADDIASGRLVEVLSEWTPAYPGYCLYYPGRRHMAASLRAFVDLAQEIVSRNRSKGS
jgi:DNA-binding transcriptional LysR family regulator